MYAHVNVQLWNPIMPPFLREKCRLLDQKLLTALQILGHGTAHHRNELYLKISKATSKECLKHFCSGTPHWSSNFTGVLYLPHCTHCKNFGKPWYHGHTNNTCHQLHPELKQWNNTKDVVSRAVWDPLTLCTGYGRIDQQLWRV